MSELNEILDVEIVREKINEAMNKTKKTGKEHGFNICFDNDITTTAIVKGDRDSVTIENTCPGKKIGSFHVHTWGRDAFPSPKDLKNLRENGEERFFCIGLNVKSLNGTCKIVKCYNREDLF